MRALPLNPAAFERDIPTRKLVDRLLRRAGIGVRTVMELDNIETIKRTVEAGIGVSLLPAPALVSEVRARSLAARGLRESPIQREIGVIYRRNRELSRGTRAFLELLKGELG